MFLYIRKIVFSVFASVLLGEVILALILAPLESKLIYVFWTTLYFFPFFFAGLLAIILLLNLGFVRVLRNVFESKAMVWIMVVLLIGMMIETWQFQHTSPSVYLFLANTLSFSFSIFFYFKIQPIFGK